MRLAPPLVNYARRYVDDFSAEDIVHEAFLKFYVKLCKNIKGGGKTDEEIQKILYVAVRNLCRDQLRHESCMEDYKTRKRAELTLREIATENEDAEDADKSLIDKVKALVETLPEKRKEIFKMYYYRSFDSKKIAETLSLSQRTVENNVYRALCYLRSSLSGEGKR